MTCSCSCSSCVSLGYAKPRHVGDCDSCNADGETEAVVHDECEFELCVKCHSNAPDHLWPEEAREGLVSSTTWTGLPYVPPELTKEERREINMESWDEEMGS